MPGISKKKTKNSYSLALKDAFAVSEPDNPQPYVDYRAQLEWREGVPYLTSVPIRISEEPENSLRTLLRKCLDLPYDGKDPSLQGLSQGEAMVLNLVRDAAAGFTDAREQVLDRIMGKPQQNIKSVNLSGDLNDFLDQVAKDTHLETIEVTPEPTQPDTTEDL